MDTARQRSDGKNELGEGSVLEEFKEIGEIKSLISSLKDIYNDQIAVEASFERFNYIVDLYQEQPHLIDPHLEGLMIQLLTLTRDTSSPPKLIHQACKYLYLVTKTRGFKVIMRQFPHEVADVEPVLGLLAKQDPYNFEAWETRYMLVLWLSMVSMIPFDMSRLDSNITMESGEKKKPVMDRIIDVGQLYLLVNDKSRDAAAYLMSRFLTRPDVKKLRLPEVLDWAMNIIHNADRVTMAGVTQISGCLRMLSLLFKHGKREDLLEYAPIVLSKVEEMKLSQSNNTFLRKFGIKVIQRIGLTFLKYRVASWRYQRGTRSLADNLSVSKSQTSESASSSSQQMSEDEEEEYDIAEELEEIIEELLAGLKDKDTIVRWSAAKGIGRITGRLPRELADEVVGSVLELFTLQESDGAWHGGCLALAELGRRGLLVTERLPDVVPVVLKALLYDEMRGNFSVGAHVRDAACYVCWAFARAYEPCDITPYVNNIASALVKASIFDREVNVRRAAAAAFQENVGRQGTFPHGIDILTMADYFAVGNRGKCYLELSVFIAQFPEYTESLIDHLTEIKISHWDSVMRELTAKALHKLTAKSPEYMVNKVLPDLLPKTTGIDLYLRHGTILSVAEITHAVAILVEQQKRQITEYLNKDILEQLRSIAKKLLDQKLFRGLGGEFMRKAVSCSIEKLSLSKLPFHQDPVIDIWQEIIDDCLHHIEPDVMMSAVSAIPAFFTEYYREPSGTAIPSRQEQIVDKFLKELKSPVENSRMGYSLAIGALPKFMVHGRLDSILNSLVATSQVVPNEQKMADARRDAVKAIRSICHSVGFESAGSPSNVLCARNIKQLYDALFVVMNDYTLDSRGDVGAWTREASMTALTDLTVLVVGEDPSQITPEITKHLFCCLAQQACEKIDRTRAHAGKLFEKLLHHEPEIPHIPCKEELVNVFSKTKIRYINWGAPADTFPKFTQLLEYPTYMYSVLKGLTVSVGGLTESLVHHSSASLYSYMRTIQWNREKLLVFTDLLLQLFQDHIKVDRVSVPILKMLDQIMARGCFAELMDDDSCKFAMELIELVRKEIFKSGDPQKLLASVDVFCGLLQFPELARKKALSHVLILMCHKYPKVRKTAANKLYEALVTFEELCPAEVLDEVMTIISETSWDDPVETVRPLRNQLCDLMNVKRPVLRNPPTDAKPASAT